MSIFDQYPEVDSNGQRFRWMGEACKEYMPMVRTDGDRIANPQL